MADEGIQDLGDEEGEIGIAEVIVRMRRKNVHLEVKSKLPRVETLGRLIRS